MAEPSQPETPPNEPAAPVVSPDWQAAVKRIRDTADWIAKAFTAIAALLIGTGPLLVRLSDITSGQQALTAVLGAVAALFGVGAVIFWATQVMLPETTDLAEIMSAKRGPLFELRQHVETPVGRSVYLDPDINDVAGLVTAIKGWHRTVAGLGRYAVQARAYDTLDPPPDPATLPEDLRDPAARASIATTYASAQAHLRQLSERAAELVRQGVYVEVRHTFLRARRMMLAGGALAAAGVAVYIAALGVADEAKDKSEGKAASTSLVTIETLTWNQTPPQGSRPVGEVRQALGFDANSCDTVQVVVQSGKGNQSDPWRLTSVRGGRCAEAPRTFTIDDRYATVTSEPATTFTLEPGGDPPMPWGYLGVGVLLGAAVIGAGRLVAGRRKN